MLRWPLYLAGPTGGLSYHYTALKYRSTLWRPYLHSAREWILREWKPREPKLVIIGASAGWSLDPDILASFKEVIAIEPDPLAKRIFEKRFRSLNVKTLNRTDLLPWFTRPFGSVEPLEKFLDETGEAAVLFSNVLGQVALLNKGLRDEDHLLAGSRLLKCLERRNWASYHDIFSASVPPRLPDSRLVQIQSNTTAMVLAEQFYPNGAELTDHLTLWISQRGTGQTRLTDWQIRPGKHHLVGFTHS